MIETPSSRAVQALRAMGRVAPVCALEQRLAARRGLPAARLAIDLAIVAGRIQRVTMIDGSPGVELLEGGR